MPQHTEGRPARSRFRGRPGCPPLARESPGGRRADRALPKQNHRAAPRGHRQTVGAAGNGRNHPIRVMPTHIAHPHAQDRGLCTNARSAFNAQREPHQRRDPSEVRSRPPHPAPRRGSRIRASRRGDAPRHRRHSQQRHAAVEIAKSVRGVRDVYDELSVDLRDHWDDAEIRGAALQALMSSPDVPADQIEVKVDAAWLTMRGRSSASTRAMRRSRRSLRCRASAESRTRSRSSRRAATDRPGRPVRCASLRPDVPELLGAVGGESKEEAA